MPDTGNYVYLAMTGNGWGAGKTESEAVRNCKLHMGTEHVRKWGYVVYHVHPNFRISEVDGTIFVPRDAPNPVVVTHKMKRTK